MKHGSLFSGIGGFDLAADWMGWENVFHCEIAEFPRKILNYYWPKAESYEDIKKTDFTKWCGTVDIISGGFPCQPYSAAGKRLGKEDDRHLWPEMLRVIREVKPQWVVGENVRGLLNWNSGMVFHEVCSDLENIGYEVQAFIIPASGINAPHQRERLWIVAKNALLNGCIFGESIEKGAKDGQFGNIGTRITNGIYLSERFTAHTDNTRTHNGMQSNGERNENDEQRRGQSQSEHWENGINGNVADTNGSKQRDNGGKNIGKDEKVWRNKKGNVSRKLCGNGNATDPESKRTWEQSSENRGWEDGRFNDISKDGNVADTNGIGLWGKGDRVRESKFNGKNYKGNNWETFPTQSPICSGDDGISHGLDNITFSKWRNESIKGYGNAVVPQVVYRIFKTIEYIQSLNENQ